MDPAEVAMRVDRAVTATIPVSVPLGGVDPKDYGQVLEYAKTMATARHGIKEWLRGNVGDCLMICSRAMRWRMDPWFVAEKCYLMVSQSNKSMIGWESQLVHAVVEALAPLKNRLRYDIEGDGDDRRCIVWGTFRGEEMPHRFKSETLGKRIKDIGRNQSGNFRGSPLWLTKPEVQLFYDASRDWARINCPDVLAGVYTPDELLDMEAVDVMPTGVSAPVGGRPMMTELANRLKESTKAGLGRGFNADHVNREAAARSSILDGEIISEQQKESKDERSNDEPVGERRENVDPRGDVRDRNTSGSGEGSGAIKAVRAELTGKETPPAQADLLPPADRPKGKTKDKR